MEYKICETCGKKIYKKNSSNTKDNWYNRKFCNSECRSKRWDLCECGNKKLRSSKHCKVCCHILQRGIPQNLNESNGMWKGNNVGRGALHVWIKKRKPKPNLCGKCHKNKPYDLTNISGKYKRDVNDFEWLCRRCHMIKDGRLKNNLRLAQKKGKENPKYSRITKICEFCKKKYTVYKNYSKSRFCSQKCWNKWKSDKFKKRQI